MSDEKQPQPFPRKPRPIGELLAQLDKWDYTHKEVMDKLIIVNAIKLIDTQHGAALLCDCVVANQDCKVLIGGMVLMKHLLALEEELPVSATIVRTGTYYTFQ